MNDEIRFTGQENGQVLVNMTFATNSTECIELTVKLPEAAVTGWSLTQTRLHCLTLLKRDLEPLLVGLEQKLRRSTMAVAAEEVQRLLDGGPQ